MAESFTQAMEALCTAADEYNASDLLLHEGRPPQVRISGSLMPLEFAPLDGAFFDALWRICGAREEAQDHDSSLTSEAAFAFA
jgi:Tfp pilus assembly pilus retraction ATPase PilT